MCHQISLSGYDHCRHLSFQTQFLKGIAIFWLIKWSRLNGSCPNGPPDQNQLVHQRGKPPDMFFLTTIFSIIFLAIMALGAGNNTNILQSVIIKPGVNSSTPATASITPPSWSAVPASRLVASDLEQTSVFECLGYEPARCNWQMLLVIKTNAIVGHNPKKPPQLE